MKTLTQKFVFLFLMLAAGWSAHAQSCDYKLEKYDSFGDGWNGGQLIIKINGVPNVFTLSTGSYGENYFSVPDGASISLSYTAGSFASEVSFKILDSDMMLVYQSTSPPTVGTDFFTTTGSCPTCPSVSAPSVQFNSITSNSAVVTWSAGVGGTYQVEYGPAGFVPGSGVTANTINSLYSMTGLNDGVTYHVYIRRDCGAQGLSKLAGPFAFTTTSSMPNVPCNYQLLLITDYFWGWSGASVLFNNSVDPATTYSNFIGPFVSNNVVLYQNKPATFTYNAGYNEGYQDNILKLVPIPGTDTITIFDGTQVDKQKKVIIGCPTCKGPTEVTADPQSSNANINWTLNGGTGNIIVEYGPIGFTLGTGTVKTVQDFLTSTQISGLSPNSHYEVYVWMDCGGGNKSYRNGPILFKTLPTTDVGIVGFASPVSACNLSSQTKVTVRIKNYGGNPQSLIPFKYSVNGVVQPTNPPQDGVFTGVITNDSISEFSFDIPYNFAPSGTYTISAWTEMPGDANVNNDTFTTVIVSIPTENAPYYQNFESWSGAWLPYDNSNGVWEYGTPNKDGITGSYSGTKAWVTKLSGNYPVDPANIKEYFIESPCFDLSGVTGVPHINLALNYNTPTGYDGMYLQASKNNGLTWETIGSTSSGVNWYSTNSFYVTDLNFWSGSSSGWVIASHPLAGYAGQSQVRFRMVFHVHNFSWFQYGGVAFDDIWITAAVAKDLAAVGLSRASTSECGSPSDNIKIVIKNFGTSPQTGFDVGYQAPDGTTVTENVGTLVVLPNNTTTYTFTASTNTKFELGQYKVWTNLNGDFSAVNDTFQSKISLNVPKQLSFKEDFNSSFSIPQGWNTTSTFFVSSSLSSGSNLNVLAANLYSFNTVASITSPSFGPINSGDPLTFDYRYTVYFSFGTTPYTLAGQDSLALQLSTDCGETWSTAWLLTAANQPLPATADFKNVSIDLSPYAGQYLNMRFVAGLGNPTGDYHIALDNINVQGCPVSFNLEATSTNDIGNTGVGTLSVSGSTGNPPLTFSWSNGATSATLSGLLAGTYTVTVTDALGCSKTASYTVQNTVDTDEENFVRRATLVPNPTSGTAQLIVELGQPADLEVEVLSVVGMSVELHRPGFVQQTTLPLDLSDLPAGIYFVQLRSGHHRHTLRLVKQ